MPESSFFFCSIKGGLFLFAIFVFFHPAAESFRYNTIHNCFEGLKICRTVFVFYFFLKKYLENLISLINGAKSPDSSISLGTWILRSDHISSLHAGGNFHQTWSSDKANTLTRR